MKYFYTLFFIFIFALTLCAQNGAEITGLLPSANAVEISLTDNSGNKIQTVKTDAKGNYKFENIADGDYKIVYRDSGNQTREIAVIVRNGKQVSIVENVCVVASGTAQNFDEVSKSVNQIDEREIRDRAEFSSIEALKTIPGLRIQQLGGFGRTANIKTRGLRNQDTAILLDGIRFRDATAITGDASPFLSDLTLTNIDRIEILRGSGSSVYGTNAVGGAIDFRTAVPKNGFHGGLSAMAGGYGLKRFGGNLSDGNDKIGYNLAISRTLYTEGIDSEDDAHNTNFRSRIEYNPFSKTNLSGRIFVGDSYVRLNSDPDTIGTLPVSNATIIKAVPLSISELNRYANGAFSSALYRGNATFIPDTNDPDNFQKGGFFNGQIVLTQVISDNLISRMTYQFLRTNRRNTNGVRGVGYQPFGGSPTSIYEGKIHTLDWKLDWTVSQNNLLTLGYEYEAENFLNQGLAVTAAGNFETRAKQTSNTFYAQDQLSFFNRKLQLSGAFRAQFFSLKSPVFSSNNAPYKNLTLENPLASYTGDGSVSYFFNSTGTKIRAHAGNGYRVPSLYERFGSYYSTFGTPGFVALGDPELKPERSLGMDAGIDQTFYSNRAKLSATWFYTRLQDVIGYGNGVRAIPNSPRFGGYLNTKGGISRGGEFSAEIKPFSATQIFASYTFTNSDQFAPQVSGSGIYESLGVPTHQFSIVATQRIADRLTLNFDFLATSSYLAPIFSNTTFRSYVYEFKGARRGDITASYEIPAFNEKVNFRIFGTIENVFGYDYFENGFRTFGRTARAGAGVNF